MSVFKPTKIEWVTFLILMPVINIITLYIMFGESIWKRLDVLFIVFSINYVIGLFTFFLNVFIMHKFQQKWPHLNQTVKRVILIVVSHITITIAIFGVVFNIYDAASL